MNSKNPIVIHTMAKVGSTTMMNSLIPLKLGVPIYHVHLLTENERENQRQRCKTLFTNFSEDQISKLKEDEQTVNMFDRLNHPKFNVITLIRDPVARNISGYFQCIDRIFPNVNKRLKSRAIKTEEIIDYFFKNYHHNFPLGYLDSEIKPVWDIDVFASSFPKSRGYRIYRSSKANLLLLKLEKLDFCAGNALNDFLGIENFRIEKDNTSEKKPYHIAYQEFLKNITFSEDYLDKMYGSRLIRHFYDKEEIVEFRKRWGDPR